MKLFEENARVAFLGDSVTANGLFIAFMADYYKKHFPERHVQFFNCGVSGDYAGGAWARLETDVERFHPTEMVIMFGMNDIGRELYGQDNPSQETLQNRQRHVDYYVTNFVGLVKHYRDKGLPVTVCTTPCYDEYSFVEEKNLYGINEAVEKPIAQINEQVSKLNVKGIIDVFTNLRNLYMSARQNNIFVCPDRLHPTRLGHYFISRVILSGQGCDVQIPTIEQMLALDEKQLQLSPLNEKRWQAELKLRNIGFVEWNNRPFDQEHKTNEQKAKYWQEHYPEMKAVGEYQYNMTKFYAEHKLEEEKFVQELLQITAEFDAN